MPNSNLQKGCYTSNKFDLKQVDELNNTILHVYCKKNDISINIINDMLEYGVNVNFQNKVGNTPFHIVCNNLNISYEIIEVFLNKKADANLQNKKGETPFHNICNNDLVNCEIINIFLKSGANANINCDDNKNPFEYICSNEAINLSIIKLFIESQTIEMASHYNNVLNENTDIGEEIKNIVYFLEINAKDSNDGDTKLHKAVKKEDIKEINNLLNQGALPNLQNKQGATPLHIAYSLANKKIIKLLLHKKADPSIVDKKGFTPEQWDVKNVPIPTFTEKNNNKVTKTKKRKKKPQKKHTNINITDIAPIPTYTEKNNTKTTKVKKKPQKKHTNTNAMDNTIISTTCETTGKSAITETIELFNIDKRTETVETTGTNEIAEILETTQITEITETLETSGIDELKENELKENELKENELKENELKEILETTDTNEINEVNKINEIENVLSKNENNLIQVDKLNIEWIQARNIILPKIIEVRHSNFREYFSKIDPTQEEINLAQSLATILTQIQKNMPHTEIEKLVTVLFEGCTFKINNNDTKEYKEMKFLSRNNMLLWFLTEELKKDNSNIELCIMLHSKLTNPNIVNGYGQTLLHILCKKSTLNYEIIGFFINKIDLTIKDCYENSALMYAYSNRNTNNFDINFQYSEKNTLLHYMCNDPVKYKELILFFIKNGACVTLENNDKMTARSLINIQLNKIQTEIFILLGQIIQYIVEETILLKEKQYLLFQMQMQLKSFPINFDKLTINQRMLSQEPVNFIDQLIDEGNRQINSAAMHQKTLIEKMYRTEKFLYLQNNYNALVNARDIIKEIDIALNNSLKINIPKKNNTTCTKKLTYFFDKELRVIPRKFEAKPPEILNRAGDLINLTKETVEANWVPDKDMPLRKNF